MTGDLATSAVAHGWTLFAHPIFVSQLQALVAEVESLRLKDAEGYKSKNATKRLAAIRQLALEVIPQNPQNPIFRQGKTLGSEHSHWYRAKFFQQYRLFFRFHEQAHIIVYGWVNDPESKRAYGSSSDAYRVFRRMLEAGAPPSDWEALLNESSRADLGNATSESDRGPSATI
ncbi:MAG: type II toxin-antitoxin system YhaV family toxin [Actinomycetota bacterium]|nr:type II toxin-antitoxin system YhaV family toxin [Actinomycetota bacterium]